MNNDLFTTIWENACIFSRHDTYYLYDCCLGVIAELPQHLYDAIAQYGIDSDECIDLKPLKVMRDEFDDTNNEFSFSADDEYIAYLSFAPTHECNLNCSYCYGGQGKNYIGNVRGFDEKAIKKLLDVFVNTIYKDASSYRIDFVGGGEPLLNFSAVKNTIDYIEKLSEESGKSITVWLCTNATLMTDEIAAYLVDHKVPLGISIDGNRQMHNKTRPFKNGKGSFDAVLEGIEKYRKYEKVTTKSNLWALCTATNDNCDFVNIIQTLKALGFNNAQIRLIRSKEHYNIEKIVREYDKLFDFLIDEYKHENLDSLLMILNDNDQFGKIIKRVMLNQHAFVRCLAGWRRITVCPDGSVYPCDSFVGNKDYCMGSIENEKEILFKNSINRPINLIEKCAQCDVRFICGGDCYYNAFEKTGSPLKPDTEYCTIQKHLVMNAIALCCYMSNENEKLYDELSRKVEIKHAYSSIRG